MLSRRLTDLTEAGFLSKTDAPRGKQGKYSLTELGIHTLPLMMEMARLGILIDASTAKHRPDFAQSSDPTAVETKMTELRDQHING